MAKTIYPYVRMSNDIVGFTVDDQCIKEGENRFCGLPMIPLSIAGKTFNPHEHSVITAVGFLEMNELRMSKYYQLKELGYKFSTYIHNSVDILDGVSVEENCIILNHVSIHPGTTIGAGTFISGNVNIGHDCNIGVGNWINAGVSIAGNTTINRMCFFGVNSSVGDNVTIGEKNFVSANTFVGKDTNDNEVYLSENGQRFNMNSKSFLKFIRNTKA